jgi:organic radical activating enzyme
MTLDRISIEPSRFCSKACAFCYNGSSRDGRTGFSASDVIHLATDCAAHGVRYVSLGGGEPLEWPGLFETLEALRGVLGRSFTTNGLPLEKNPSLYERIAAARPDKVHVSIHQPAETTRVAQQVTRLAELGIPSGVNLLVRRSALDAARDAVEKLVDAGLDANRIVLLPMRGSTDVPSAQEVASVARALGPFQSMTCLRGCAKSERFASIGADRTVAWCSYTVSRRPLRALTHAALVEALDGLELRPCEQRMVRDDQPSSAQGTFGRA